MAKRAKIEKIFVVVSRSGGIVGCGIDAPSACRDAVENAGRVIELPPPTAGNDSGAFTVKSEE